MAVVLSALRFRPLTMAAALVGLVVLAGCGASGSSSTGTGTSATVRTTRQPPAPTPRPHRDRKRRPAADRPPRRLRRRPPRAAVSGRPQLSLADLRPEQHERHGQRHRPEDLRVTDTFPVGGLPQHVVPSYDLKTLWVTNDEGNSLTPIDPATGKPGKPVPVTDPYNLYFTPDGRYAIAVAERLQRLDFLDAALHEAPQLAARPLDGRGPHGLHGGRALPAGELRVRLEPGGRTSGTSGSSAPCRSRAARCRRTSSSRPTARPSTSPT